MSAANGTTIPILKLGDLTPDTRPVQVERMGQSITLSAYLDGPRCPGYIKAKVSKARATYGAIVYVDGPDGEQVFQDDEEAWDTYLREVLVATIEGLTYPEAEVLAGNQPLAVETLRELGWVRRTEEDAAPEAPGEELSSTTEDSSPGSAVSTTSRRTRS